MKAWEMQPDGIHPIIRFGSNPSLDNPATAKQVEEFIRQEKGQPSKSDATEMVDSWIPLPDGSGNKWPCRMILRNENGGWKLSHLYFFGGPHVGADAWADRYAKTEEAAGLFGKKQPIPDWIPFSQPQPQPQKPQPHSPQPPAPSPEQQRPQREDKPKHNATSTTHQTPKGEVAAGKPRHAKAGIPSLVAYCVIATLFFVMMAVMIVFVGRGSSSAEAPQNPAPAPKTATTSSDEPSTWPPPGQGQIPANGSSLDIPQPLAPPRPSEQKGGPGAKIAAKGSFAPDTAGINAQNDARIASIRNHACTPTSLKSWPSQGGPLFIGFCQCTRQTIGTTNNPGATSCPFMVRNDDVVSHAFAIEEPISVTDDLGYHSNQRTGDVRCGRDGQSFTLAPGIPVSCTLIFQDTSDGANRFANIALSVLWERSSGPYPPIYRIPIGNSR